MPVNDQSKRNLAIQAHVKLMKTLEELQCDPIAELAKHAMDPNTDLSSKIKILSELANYVHPKKKSVDISSGGENGLVIRIKRYSAAEAKETIGDPDAMKQMLKEDYGHDTEDGE